MHNAELYKFEIKLYLILSQNLFFRSIRPDKLVLLILTFVNATSVSSRDDVVAHQFDGPVENAFANSLGQVPVAFGLLWLPCPFWRGQVAKEIAGVRTESRSVDNGLSINSSGNEQSALWDVGTRYMGQEFEQNHSG